MTRLQNTAETGLADGTAVTVANSDDGAAGNALSLVSTAGGGTITYRTAAAASGSLGYRLAHGTDSCSIQFGAGGLVSGPTMSLSFNFSVDGAGVASEIFRLFSAGGGNACSGRYDAAGTLSLLSAGGVVFVTTPVLTPGTQYRIDAWVTPLTATTGRIGFRVFVGSDTLSPIAVYDSLGTNLGNTVGVGGFRFGRAGAGSALTLTIDNLIIDDGIGEEFIGYESIQHRRTHTGGTIRGTGTDVTLALSADVPPARLLVVGMSFDNVTASTPTLASLTKPPQETNTWTILDSSAAAAAGAGNSIRGAMAWIITTTTWIAATDSPIASLSEAVVSKSGVMREYSGAARAIASTGGVSSLGSPTATLTGLTAGQLVVGVGSFETSAAPTADADTVGGSWSAQTLLCTPLSGGGNTNAHVSMQHKVLTANSDQTFNPLRGTDDANAMMIAFPVAPPITRGSVALAGSGALTVTGFELPSRTVELAGSGTLEVTGEVGRAGSVELAGSGTLAATGSPALPGSVELAGSGTLAATGIIGYTGQVALSGSGTLALTPGTMKITTTVPLAGAGTLAPTATAVWSSGSIASTGSGVVSLAGQAGPARSVNFYPGRVMLGPEEFIVGAMYRSFDQAAQLGGGALVVVGVAEFPEPAEPQSWGGVGF